MTNYEKLSDEQLVQQIRNTDQELYRYLIVRYEKKIMRYVNYLIHDESKSADVVQDSFIKAFVNLQGFNTNKKFSSWLYRIAHNEAMNAVKKHHREVQMPDNFDVASLQDLAEDLNRKQVIVYAAKCLSQLPISYSEPLALYYLEEKSYEEISDILRLPIGTVGTRINRAKVMMKKICRRQN